MRFKRCTDEKGQRICCAKCITWLPLKEAWADLDGKPFVDYYCDFCTQELRTKEDGPQDDDHLNWHGQTPSPPTEDV